MKLIITTFALVLASSVARGDTLDQVRQRGSIRCGINPALAGFGRPDANGVYRGLNADLCRAFGAAIFDDPGKVTFVPLSAKDRLVALQAGEIDVLAHNTTWTMSRNAQLEFPAIVFFDGQGFMTRKQAGIASAKELRGASICAQQGSTTELNLADYFRTNGITYEVVTFATNDEALAAYRSGRCDALTTDITSLYAERVKLPDPEAHFVLPEVIAKEPLAPAVRRGDGRWTDIVRWTVFALFNAEELGITQANIDQMRSSANPEIRRLLGIDSAIGEQFGLSADWAFRVLRHVGNYGEVFDRNLGAGSPMQIRRGLNELWSKGGLHYAPPVR